MKTQLVRTDRLEICIISLDHSVSVSYFIYICSVAIVLIYLLEVCTLELIVDLEEIVTHVAQGLRAESVVVRMHWSKCVIEHTCITGVLYIFSHSLPQLHLLITS